MLLSEKRQALRREKSFPSLFITNLWQCLRTFYYHCILSEAYKGDFFKKKLKFYFFSTTSINKEQSNPFMSSTADLHKQDLRVQLS